MQIKDLSQLFGVEGYFHGRLLEDDTASFSQQVKYWRDFQIHTQKNVIRAFQLFKKSASTEAKLNCTKKSSLLHHLAVLNRSDLSGSQPSWNVFSNFKKDREI